MPLINGMPILHLLRGYRVAHLAGRFGSGKTALVYRLAHDLCQDHGFRYILSNCEDVWSDDPDDIVLRPDERGVPTYMDAVVILDEGGSIFTGASHARQFVAFMRKFNVCLLLPSVEPPPSRVKFLQIIRKYNFGALGLPLWWFEARLSTGLDRVKYQFGWWGYSEIFGIYDTYDFPGDDAGIGEFLAHHVEEKTFNRRKRRRREPTRPAAYDPGAGWRTAGPDSPLVGRGRESEAFADAALEMSDAVSALVEVQEKTRKRRR